MLKTTQKKLRSGQMWKNLKVLNLRKKKATKMKKNKIYKGMKQTKAPR